MTGFGREFLEISAIAITQTMFLMGGALLLCDLLCRLIYVYYGIF